MPGQHLDQVQLNIRIALSHCVDQWQGENSGSRGRHSDGDISTHSPTVSGHDRIFGLPQTQLGMVQERHTGAGRCDASSGAIKEAG
ncbi:hypothetical protein D3C75_958980 [compost metagenome]